MYRKKSITNLILLSLEKTIDGYVRFEDFVYNPGLYAYYGWEYPLKKSSFAKALKRLRENGLVELISDQKLIYRLTDKGKEKAVLASFLQDDKKWDGKWRLIIFDVPEKRRAARDVLRRKLKEWEFIHFQQSVWGTKKNCTEPLRDFIKSVGIEDWVMVVETDNIGDIGR
ncbi:MAG: hypothetical protein Q7R97_03305 [Candidatus Daviesbacteria bacterium]|nr:hypothetical protein [Candidatus Daviesbacteria bacterium]